MADSSANKMNTAEKTLFVSGKTVRKIVGAGDAVSHLFLRPFVGRQKDVPAAAVPAGTHPWFDAVAITS